MKLKCPTCDCTVNLNGPNLTELVRCNTCQCICCWNCSGTHQSFTHSNNHQSFTQLTKSQINKIINVNKKEIKKLESTIVYHNKSIQAIKDHIHEKRSDYDNYIEVGDCGKHKNCKLYNKPNSTKHIHRRIPKQNWRSSYFPDIDFKFSRDLINIPVTQNVNQISNLDFTKPLTDFNIDNHIILNPGKICTKKIIACKQGVGCSRHYRCKICYNIHLTKKETRRQRISLEREELRGALKKK